ncbi:MAG: branched-chain amino acid ABC transporter permease [Lacisediminihabitans sp.]
MNVLPSIVSGLGDGMLLFLIASGLSVIFGAMRFLNFAHGAFFAIGGYLTYNILSSLQLTPVLLIGGALLAGLGVAALAYISEVVVFRRLYKLPPIDSLLGTYALLLLLEGAILVVWGPNSLSVPYPKGLNSTVRIGSVDVPQYSLLLIAVGVIVVVAMSFLLYKTSLGLEVRALAEDRPMTQLLGVNISRVSAKVMLIGGFLAGIGGALATPTIALTPDLATSFIIQAFAVVVVGGLGSFYGALIAAVVLGVTQSIVVTYIPSVSGIAFYATMFAILLFRPQGILGKSSVEIS